MKHNLAAFACGLLFVLGLGISGMTDPQKVLAFLDVTGKFDPSLMAVMGGAVAVSLIGFRLVLRRTRPAFSARFHLPRQTRIDAPLVVGAVLFGVGWGLSGYCPGPALASVVTLTPSALVFVASMLVGMAVHRWVQVARGEREPISTPDPLETLSDPAE